MASTSSSINTHKGVKRSSDTFSLPKTEKRQKSSLSERVMRTVSELSLIGKISGEVNSLRKAVKELDIEKALQTAHVLQKFGWEAGEAFYTCDNDNHIPLPIALDLIDILCDERIQFCDQLRHEIARTTRFFAEFTLLKAELENREVYASTKEQYIKKLKGVVQALPKSQAGLFLEFKCLKGAVKRLRGGGLHQKYLAHGFKAAITLSPNELMRLVARMWSNERQSGEWFGVTFNWRWGAIGLETLDDYKKFEEEILGSLGKGRKFSLSASEVFISILKHSKVRTIRDEAFKRLLDLSHISKSTQKKQTKKRALFWKTRFLSVQYLQELSLDKNSDFRNLSLTQLADCFMKEKNRHVGLLLTSFYKRNREELTPFLPPDLRDNDEDIKKMLDNSKEASQELESVREEMRKLCLEEQTIQTKGKETVPGLEGADYEDLVGDEQMAERLKELKKKQLDVSRKIEELAEKVAFESERSNILKNCLNRGPFNG